MQPSSLQRSTATPPRLEHLPARWYAACETGAAETPTGADGMAVQFRTSGCLWSIVVSVVLTVVLNLALRGCAGGGPSW